MILQYSIQVLIVSLELPGKFTFYFAGPVLSQLSHKLLTISLRNYISRSCQFSQRTAREKRYELTPCKTVTWANHVGKQPSAIAVDSIAK